MAEIFISYAKEDAAKARAIQKVLEERYTTAIDCDIPAGVRFRDWIDQHLRNASACVVLWSEQAVRKSWVLDEAGEINRASKPLVPIIIDDALDSDAVPLGFRQLQYLRCKWLSPGEVSRETADALLSSLDAHLQSRSPLNEALSRLEVEVREQLGDDYESFESLGTGRLSVVFKARNKASGKYAALSVTPLAGILLFPGFLAHFKCGVEAAQMLRHENILELRELLFRGNIACTIMEYVEGHSLSRLIARGPMPLDRVRSIGVRLAEGMSFAHSRNVVHANLRSACILVDVNHRPVISDFSMALMRGGADITTTNTALFCDPRYMSPEQCRGEVVSYYSDQYALGVILFEMLTGSLPFTGGSPFTIMQRQCNEPAPAVDTLRPDCPPAIAATVAKLLAKNPVDRFPSNARLLSAMRRWLASESPARGNPLSRTPERAAFRAKDSYRRCLAANREFLIEFYERLLKNEQLQKHLSNLFIDKQAEMLERAIGLLLDLAVAKSNDSASTGETEASEVEIARIARAHQKMGLGESDFEVFTRVLIDLALETDPEAGAGKEREALRGDWQAAMLPGVRRMTQACCPPPILPTIPPVNRGAP